MIIGYCIQGLQQPGNIDDGRCIYRPAADQVKRGNYRFSADCISQGDIADVEMYGAAFLVLEFTSVAGNSGNRPRYIAYSLYGCIDQLAGFDDDDRTGTVVLLCIAWIVVC